MRTFRSSLTTAAALAALAVPAAAGTLKCPADSVKVGNVCIDKYEASVWQIPAANTALVKKVQSGKATLADLTGGGSTQVSPSPTCTPGFPLTFTNNGNWTDPLYAVSVPGAPPSACVTWFQAEQACALSGKRLVTNQEWQRAAAGTPDPGATPGALACNTNSGGPSNTGARTACVSKWGAFDMVGNVYEWVGDWGETAAGCTNWSAGGFGGDDSCFGGDGSNNLPGALLRGGSWFSGTGAGVFAVGGGIFPSTTFVYLGFRCAR